MKIKPDITLAPELEDLVAHVNNIDFANHVLVRVLETHLLVEDVLDRPAEYYVQRADRMLGSKFGLEVRLTGATVTAERTDSHFHDALRELHSLYKRAIEASVPKGDMVQLMAVIMVDGNIRGFDGAPNRSVIETEAEWVAGRAT